MAKPPRENSAAEIEAFCDVCDRLGGFDHLTTPERADGFLAAAAVTHRSMDAEALLPLLAGDAFERAFADPDDHAHAVRVFKARMAVLHDQLDAEALWEAPDELRLSPYMLAWGEAEQQAAVRDHGVDPEMAAAMTTGGVWAEGFLAAVDALPNPVAGASDDDEDASYRDDLISQVAVLMLRDGEDALLEHLDDAYGRRDVTREQLVDAACFAVQDLWLWTVDHAPKPATRQVEKSPGRNDPCPCGSGKKFKKCHGA